MTGCAAGRLVVGGMAHCGIGFSKIGLLNGGLEREAEGDDYFRMECYGGLVVL